MLKLAPHHTVVDAVASLDRLDASLLQNTYSTTSRACTSWRPRSSPSSPTRSAARWVADLLRQLRRTHRHRHAGALQRRRAGDDRDVRRGPADRRHGHPEHQERQDRPADPAAPQHAAREAPPGAEPGELEGEARCPARSSGPCRSRRRASSPATSSSAVSEQGRPAGARRPKSGVARSIRLWPTPSGRSSGAGASASSVGKEADECPSTNDSTRFRGPGRRRAARRRDPRPRRAAVRIHHHLIDELGPILYDKRLSEDLRLRARPAPVRPGAGALSAPTRPSSSRTSPTTSSATGRSTAC